VNADGELALSFDRTALYLHSALRPGNVRAENAVRCVGHDAEQAEGRRPGLDAAARVDVYWGALACRATFVRN